jgi:indolepyruvate ferredoxin oxidoreductase, alpha subunit
VFNRHDGVTVIVDNGYSAATGGQYVLSSRADVPGRKLGNSIENAVRGVGVKWVRHVHTYDMKATLGALREALSTSEPGPKVVIAEGECQLNRQRRIAPQRIEAGQRTVRQKFGVDEDLCTGDHSCIRLSGCPSLTIKPSSDPLKTDPVAYVDQSCVGCGVCGEVAHAAVLCPSFYRAHVIENPTRLDRLLARLRARVIGWLAGQPALRWT